TCALPIFFNHETNPVISGIIKVSNGAIYETASVVIGITESYEDKVYQGHVHLTTQAEVDAFAAQGYTHINGAMVIGIFMGPEYSDITDISGLITLEYVANNCYVLYNADLTNVNGLDNIVYFGGEFGLMNNPSLVSVEGLRNVRTVEPAVNEVYEFWIMQNPSLTNLDGLENLKNVGDVLIINNPSLTNINGLSGIE